MKLLPKKLALAGALLTMLAGIASGDTIKVGVLAPFSGPMAIWGEQFKNAIDVYVAQHGTNAGAHTIEFI
jgi:branched-chain amino acid transport system substrate-binding protein